MPRSAIARPFGPRFPLLVAVALAVAGRLALPPVPDAAGPAAGVSQLAVTRVAETEVPPSIAPRPQPRPTFDAPLPLVPAPLAPGLLRAPLPLPPPEAYPGPSPGG